MKAILELIQLMGDIKRFLDDAHNHVLRDQLIEMNK